MLFAEPVIPITAMSTDVEAHTFVVIVDRFLLETLDLADGWQAEPSGNEPLDDAMCSRSCGEVRCVLRTIGRLQIEK